MTQTIKSVLRSFQRIIFEWRLEQEIFNRIFPHLNNEGDFRYPFRSDEEILREVERQSKELDRSIIMIEAHAQRMPRAYGLAFRYVFYREIRRCVAQYEKVARERIKPKTCDPRLIARRA